MACHTISNLKKDECERLIAEYLGWLKHRVDRIHLESRNRVRQDKSALQTLLSRAHGDAASGHGVAEHQRYSVAFRTNL